MKDQTMIILVGILCISALEAIAITYGINGTLFTMVMVIIAGAIGYTIPSPIKYLERG